MVSFHLLSDELQDLKKKHNRSIILSGAVFLTLLIIWYLFYKGAIPNLQKDTTMLNILFSMVRAFLVIFIASLIVRLVTLLMGVQIFQNVNRHDRASLLRVFKYVIYFVAIVISVAQFSIDPQSLGISFGLLSAGLAIALQQPLLSIVGWIIIIVKKPFLIGDRVVIRNLKGDVRDIGLFFMTLEEFGRGSDYDDPTGILTIVPNNMLLTEPVINYTRDTPYVWDEIDISITYESDLNTAKQLVMDTALEVVGSDMKKAYAQMMEIFEDSPQRESISNVPSMFVSMSESSVNLSVRYLVNARSKRQKKSRITDGILNRFNSCRSVSIAYPHTQLVMEDRNLPESARNYFNRN